MGPFLSESLELAPSRGTVVKYSVGPLRDVTFQESPKVLLVETSSMLWDHFDYTIKAHRVDQDLESLQNSSLILTVSNLMIDRMWVILSSRMWDPSEWIS